MQHFLIFLSFGLYIFQYVSNYFLPLPGAQWLQRQPLLLPSYRDESRAEYVVGPVGWQPDHKQHDWHQDTERKTEAAIGVIELVMMRCKTSETRWVLNKSEDNKLINFASVGDSFEFRRWSTELQPFNIRMKF
jgi:hypothetical protein